MPKPDISQPPEAWEAADRAIDEWVEEKNYQEWLKWRQRNGF